MSSRIAAHLTQLGITLPPTTSPAGAYVSYVHAGPLVYISGQLPRQDGIVTCTGQVGSAIDEVAAKAAARLCALNVVSQLHAACDGNLDRVVRCVRLNGAVNSAIGFGRQPHVIDGASELMAEIFGERGKHTRVAVGAAALPSDASVEVDAIFEVSAPPFAG